MEVILVHRTQFEHHWPSLSTYLTYSLVGFLVWLFKMEDIERAVPSVVL